MVLREVLYNLRNDKELILPKDSIFEEIYLQIDIPDTVGKINETYRIVFPPIKFHYEINIANYDIHTDEIITPNPLLQYSPIFNKGKVFAKTENTIYINFRQKGGTFLKRLSSNSVETLNLKLNYTLLARALQPLGRDEFTDEEIRQYNLTEHQVIAYFIPIPSNKPYVLLSPAIPPYTIKKMYFYNAYQIYLINERNTLLKKGWQLLGRKQINTSAIRREILNMHYPVLASPTQQFNYTFPDAIIDVSEPVPVFEFTYDLDLPMQMDDYLLIYGGMNNLQFIFCIFEVEEVGQWMY